MPHSEHKDISTVVPKSVQGLSLSASAVCNRNGGGASATWGCLDRSSCRLFFPYEHTRACTLASTHTHTFTVKAWNLPG